MSLTAILAPILFAVAAAVTVLMVAALSKEGDERQKFILGKTAAGTFVVTLCVLGAAALRNACTLFLEGQSAEGLPPFLLLSLIAAVFAVLLFINKKRFGG